MEKLKEIENWLDLSIESCLILSLKCEKKEESKFWQGKLSAYRQIKEKIEIEIYDN